MSLASTSLRDVITLDDSSKQSVVMRNSSECPFERSVSTHFLIPFAKPRLEEQPCIGFTINVPSRSKGYN